MAKRLTWYILIAMVAGIVIGLLLNRLVTDPAQITTITGYLGIVTKLFLNLIKMIIALLVFSTLVAGIAHMRDSSALGRIGARALAWFILASLVSLTLGLIMVNLLQPGSALGLPLPPAGTASGVSQSALTLEDFITHLVPKSPIEAMANNEILQIVVFSLFFGVAANAVGEPAAPILRGIDALAAVMLKITDYVMRAAPFAVFAAVTSALAEQGPSILATFGYFMGGFYLAMLLLWLLLFAVAILIVGPRARALPGFIREPMLLAFSTASSEAAFPRTLEALERFGVPNRIASFVLPLGYSFNLDGSMIYCTFATMFIAQAYGVQLGAGEQITMLLLLMVTSKGMAGVPRASLVVISATLAFFHIPEAGLVLILAVDHFLDMGRSATNVVGNAVASAVIAKWEGAYDEDAAIPNPKV